VEVEEQRYIPGGHYLAIHSPDKLRVIIFETDGKKDTACRVGRFPGIEWVEGCN